MDESPGQMGRAVVIPTYNEVANIGPLVENIRAHAPGLHILIVDDNSPDGTADQVRKLVSRWGGIELHLRPEKRGLGTAYVEGIQRLLRNPEIGSIVTMDADLSHDPAYLPAMLAALDDFDVAVGSRYLSGISVVNWPLRRLAMSWFANRYARFVTGLSINDCTSGFVAYRRAVLEAIDLQSIGMRGYAFLIAMKHRAQRRGFRICEIPIIFYERRDGNTKMSRSIMFEAALAVWRLRFFG